MTFLHACFLHRACRRAYNVNGWHIRHLSAEHGKVVSLFTLVAFCLTCWVLFVSVPLFLPWQCIPSLAPPHLLLLTTHLLSSASFCLQPLRSFFKSELTQKDTVWHAKHI